MNKKQRNVLAMLIVVLFCVLLAGFWINRLSREVSNTGQNYTLTLSKGNGFYQEPFTVYATAAKGAEIYYTLDGSVPGKDNEKALPFPKEGVRIPCRKTEKAYNLKCVAYYPDGSVSDVECRSYITGTNIDERYDLQVLNISGDPYDFYNYENGIMVHGKLDDEFLKENPYIVQWVTEKTIPSFGNLYQSGRESEKLVYMTLFDEKGNVLVEQNCGFRLYGGYSRDKNQPSFRLYARSEYDEKNDFDYIFFDNQYNHDKTLLLDKYQRIIVRNNGNDNGYAFMRNELSTRLAIDAGFPDAQASTPVCVYLNGEYYGVLWLMTNFDDEYFQQTYGDYEGQMYIFEGTVNELKLAEDEEDQAYIDLVKEYEEKQAFFASCDLNEESNWNALNEFMDVENFIHYTAIHHYISNYDTMTNNYRIYRYYDENGNYTPDTVFDGRFRFLLFDMDYSFGLKEYHRTHIPATSAKLTSERVHDDEEEYQLFANIMSRTECRDMYIRYFLSCGNYYYSKEYVSPILEELHAKRYDELSYAISQEMFLNNLCAEDVTEMAQVEAEVEEMRQFLENRLGRSLEDLEEAFGTRNRFKLNLQNDSLSTVQVDYAFVTAQSFAGVYLTEVPPVLKAKPRVGQKFSYWMINGEDYYMEEITITADMVVDGNVYVACICEADEEAGLTISAIKPKGSSDYICLTNFGQEAVELSEYALSDSNGKKKSRLPSITVAPGESITIYCENYAGLDAFGKPGINFNIRVGETISLYKSEICVSEVQVPDLGSENSIFQINPYTGKFQEKNG